MDNRRPTTPGWVLREIMKTHSITHALVSAMGVSRFRVNDIVNNKRSVTPESALLLGKALGTSGEFWMRLQADVDLFDARKKLGKKIDGVVCL